MGIQAACQSYKILGFTAVLNFWNLPNFFLRKVIGRTQRRVGSSWGKMGLLLWFL